MMVLDGAKTESIGDADEKILARPCFPDDHLPLSFCLILVYCIHHRSVWSLPTPFDGSLAPHAS